MYKTRKQINDLAYKIVDAAIEAHKQLGPGLLESIYDVCLVEEIISRRLKVASQPSFEVNYKGRSLGKLLRSDLVVEDTVIVEIKAVEMMIPLYEAQLLSYLKLTGLPKGLLINFNTPNITGSLVPMVTEAFRLLPED
jgi:GxxExxY protein